jgi:hypothetical protein
LVDIEELTMAEAATLLAIPAGTDVDSHDTLARVTAPFVPWLRFRATPILDVKQSAAISGEALGWLSSIK